MVSVEVLSVGKELLIGKTLNTNAHWIGGRLAKMGIMIDRMVTITDSLDEISSALKYMLSRGPDFVVVLGGLGPTPDDMTLEGVSLALGRRLRVNRGAVRLIKEHYRRVWKSELVLTPSRRKMATMPDGAEPLPNEAGTAPGVRIVSGKTVIACLPGVPKEMRSIFRSSVEPEVRRLIGTLYTRTVILDLERIFESTLAPILKDSSKAYPGAYVKSHPKGTKEGVSHIELDMVVTTPERGETERLSEALAGWLTSRIVKEGGSVARKRVL